MGNLETKSTVGGGESRARDVVSEAITCSKGWRGGKRGTSAYEYSCGRPSAIHAIPSFGPSHSGPERTRFGCIRSHSQFTFNHPGLYSLCLSLSLSLSNPNPPPPPPRCLLDLATGSGSGPVIELVNASLLRPDRSYAPLSTEDPGGSRSDLPYCSTGAAMVGLPPAWVDVSEEIAADMQRARTKMLELVKAHAKALMPSFGDGKEDQHVIELLTYEITDLLKRSEKRLQKLSSSDPSEDSNVRKNVQGFNDIQMSALKRSEVLTREREREIVQVSLEYLVVESVNELAQIMKDLSVLVIDQVLF
ncbi:hypothetical protein GW17_00042691 [Ensete ventricosum]|nr:hypothetical protein GW17_00042691 [Ensete ventricosum]